MYLKYFKAAISSFLVCCIVFVLLALYSIGAPTASSGWIYELEITKSSFANLINHPKIIIASGSNSLVGINSKMITKATGITTVNTAIYAGLGIDYILDHTRSLLKHGDLVILPLEYEFYMSSAIPSDRIVDYVFAHDPKYLLTHPWFIALLSIERLKIGLFAKINPPINIESSPYKVNESGDVTNNREADMTEQNHRQIAREKPIQIPKNFSDRTSGFGSIKKFVDWCSKNQVKVLAAWPGTIWFDVYQESIYQKLFARIETFYQSINVPILGGYRKFMYDKSMFYDTRYHLHDRGIRTRTQQLINLLRPYLNEKKK